jgi:hypothetical protein
MRICQAAGALALILLPAGAAPVLAESLSFSTRIEDGRTNITSADIHMKFSRDLEDESGAIVTERGDQTVALRAPGSGPLRVRASDRGGIRVQPSTDGSYSALVCMAAGARTREAADALLERIHVEVSEDELSVRGPQAEEWATFIVLSVPPEVALDLSTTNGEIGVQRVSGRFTLRTTNGPISLDETTGDVSGDAENGPIHFRGHAGRIRLVTQNGPIGVVLDGPAWTGAGLEARSSNGPIQLSAPAGLRSGVLVEGSERSPLKWSGSARSSVAGEWERTHSARLGTGPVLVHLSTVNGPVEVRAAAAAGRKVRI